MPFSLSELCALRPFAYHVCAEQNFDSIRSTGLLRSTEALLAGTSYAHLLRGRRTSIVTAVIDGREIEIRDHAPLIEASLELPKGYSLNDFVRELNARAFFWAGTDTGPVRSGKRHLARYAAAGQVYLIRTRLAGLLRDNSFDRFEVTFCNSGSARHNGGRPACRGPDTFVAPARAPRPPREVVELTFRGQATLPKDTAYATDLKGEWRPLFDP